MILTKPHPVSESLRLADLGDFRSAKEVLGDLWRGAGLLPIRNTGDANYAWLVLACGILTIEEGALGGRFQESARDMLTYCERLMADDRAGVQAVRAWSGVAYIRSGQFHEALALADVLLADDSDANVTICASKTKCTALDGIGKTEEALKAIASINALLPLATVLNRGKVYLEHGRILRKLGRLSDALRFYELAGEDCLEANSLRYEAVAMNNLAGVYMDRGEFIRAHNSVERAISLFQRLRDQNDEGKAWDQDAQIYLREGNNRGAERTAAHAVSLLSKGDHASYLAEALITHGIVLMRTGQTRAQEQLIQAARMCSQIGSSAQAKEAYGLLWEMVVQAKDMADSLTKSLRPIEHLVIEYTLEKHDGRITPAAKELGLRHHVLEERLRKFPDLQGKKRAARRRGKSLFRHPDS